MSSFTVLAYREPGASGGCGGGYGGDGGDGDGGKDGGEGGGKGGEGGGAIVLKVALPEAPVLMLKLWSVQLVADHSAPSHPSPYESYMVRVQVPIGTTCVTE